MIKVLQYRGRGVVSKLIQWQTRSKYSHTAIQFSDGAVYEAWHTGGKWWWHGSVRKLDSPFDGHSPGTIIDVYTITEPVNEEKAREYAESQLGKRYDFGAVARFISRRNEPSDEKLFCSEYGLNIVAAGMLMLLKGSYAHYSPRDVVLSPHLTLSHTISG